MKEFGLQLKKLRKAKGLNQDELAQALGVRKTTISNYETGYSTPTAANLDQIAGFFGVTLDELYGKTVSKTTPKLSQPDIAPLNSSSLSLPVYASLSANIADSQILYTISLPHVLLGEGSFYAVKITDNRMDRATLTSESIAILRQQSFADNGDIVALTVNNQQATFGRIYQNGNLIILVAESTNPAYQPLVINSNEQPVTILGKFVKVIKAIA